MSSCFRKRNLSVLLLWLLLAAVSTDAFASKGRSSASERTLLFGSSSNSHHVNKSTVPQHVAFILDGNSRWANQRSLPTQVGHLQGAARWASLLRHLQADGVSYATFFGFSTENWKRSSKEVQEILTVMELTAKAILPVARQQKMRVKVIGDVSNDPRIPKSLQTALQQLESATQQIASPSLTLCLAVNYGGRSDLVQATQQIARLVAHGRLDPDEITSETISNQLWTSDIPDPDLLVRTSGECRLSNFLLWNCAYAELYFTDTFWPDYDKRSWRETLKWYASRQRRFGSRPQVDSFSVVEAFKVVAE